MCTQSSSTSSTISYLSYQLFSIGIHVSIIQYTIYMSDVTCVYAAVQRRQTEGRYTLPVIRAVCTGRIYGPYIRVHFFASVLGSENRFWQKPVKPPIFGKTEIGFHNV